MLRNNRSKYAAFLGAVLLYTVSGSSSAHSQSEHASAEYPETDTEFGSYEPGLEADRTIEIIMSDDMRFTPDSIVVKIGGTVRFKHHNNGDVLHEFVIGTPESLLEHAELMKKFPGMEHEEPYMIHVQPGETGEIVWKFDKPGEYGFACLIPGHFDAGMKGLIVVQ